MSKNFSRRDFLKLASITSAGLALSACGIKETELPTATMLPTNTPIPIMTSTVTPTPIPTLAGLSVSVPDPRYTNLELFDLKKSVAPIPQFVNAMKMAEITITNEQVAQGLTYRESKGKDGEPFIVGIYSISEDQSLHGDYPLLIATQINKGQFVWQPTTLKNLADKRGLNIGVTIAISYVQSWNTEHSKMEPMVANNFNQFQIGYDLMWWNPDFPKIGIRPSRYSFNFEQPDLAVEFAKRYKMQLEGTGLINQIPTFLPPWLTSLNSKDPNYKNELLSIMEDDIKTTVKRYPMVVNWTVISELENPYYKNIWTATFGLNDLAWLKQVFQWAYESNPNAKLSYSDFDIEFGGAKADKVFSIIKALKDMDTPIHTVTFQMHLNGKDFANDDLQAKIKALKTEIIRYKNIGVDVIIGEWDIDMGGVSDNQGKRWRTQTEIYHSLTSTLLEAGVTNIDFFGPPDRLNWKEQPQFGSGKNADPTLFLDDYSSKPAYFAVLGALLETQK